jgi:hypothetical protein
MRSMARRRRPGGAPRAPGWLALLACLAVSTTLPAAPPVERALKGERCVEDTATMRRDHMRFLEHQRDATVHGGIRGARHSLKGCIDCHASARTGSVAQAPTDFCISCHAYAAVKLDCFDCHSTRPARALAGVAK